MRARRERLEAIDRDARDHGATLVEAALVLPILFLLMFGILEIGMLLKSTTAASAGVRGAGRTASVAGNDPMADAQVLRRLEHDAAGLPDGEIEYIVIWHATGQNDSPAAGATCRPPAQATPNTSSVGRRVTGGGTGSCTVYHRPAAPGGAFDMADPSTTDGASQPPGYYFGCDDTTPSAQRTHKVDCNWPGRSRKVTKSPRGGGGTTTPDYFGIYIKAKHETITGILGTTFDVTDRSVSLLEPQGYSSA